MSSAPDPTPADPSPDMPLGIIAGSGFLDGLGPRSLDAPTEEVEIETERGAVRLERVPGFVFLRRHGAGTPHLPHNVPHHAHVLALVALGVRRVVGLTSTGSLRADVVPGSIVIPHDYLSKPSPPTFADREAIHIVPELDAGLRRRLIEVGEKALRTPSDQGPSGAGDARRAEPESGGGTSRRIPLHTDGVYAQTHGPRFETRAEVRALARDADIVGMTAASEATLCQEKGLEYAILSIVDNWAHGVVDEPLSLEGFRARQRANRGLAAAVLRELMRAVAT